MNALTLATFAITVSTAQRGPGVDALQVGNSRLTPMFAVLSKAVRSCISANTDRCRYDAAEILAAFSVTARDETDLQTLNDDLLGVVQETLQPAHISLWLCESSLRAVKHPSEAR